MLNNLITDDENELNNVRVNGYTIDSLNEMVYNDSSFTDGDELAAHPISCNYVLPDKFNITSDFLSILSFNIRSTKTNFDNFKYVMQNSRNALDIMGFCETHLTMSIGQSV